MNEGAEIELPGVDLGLSMVAMTQDAIIKSCAEENDALAHG